MGKWIVGLGVLPLLGAVLVGAAPARAQQQECRDLLEELGSEIEDLTADYFAGLNEAIFQSTDPDLPNFDFDETSCAKACKKAVSGCRKLGKDSVKLGGSFGKSLFGVAKVACGTIDDRVEKSGCKGDVSLANRVLKLCLKEVTQALSEACMAEQGSCEAACLAGPP